MTRYNGIYMLILLTSISQFLISQDNVQKELLILDTIEKRDSFLVAINDADQTARQNSIDICGRYYGTLDCLQSKIDCQQIDANNLKKISAYIRLYGYPDHNTYSSKAYDTPWLVMHHTVGAANKIDKEFAPYLVQEYRNGSLKVLNLHWYLKRYYLTYMGMQYTRTTSKSEEEDIEELIKVLKIL
jgi:hypothetical protein